jgi:HEAT repeat protein
MRKDDAKTAKTVVSLFAGSAPDTQLAILTAMTPERFGNDSQAEEPWKSVLTRAGASPDARLRRRAAELLEQRPRALGAQLVGPLLADEDAQTRIAAAQEALRLTMRKTKPSRTSQYMAIPSEPDDSITEFVADAIASLDPRPGTNAPMSIAGRLPQWHAALMKHPESATNLVVAAAIYATGTNKADLPLLAAAAAMANSPASLPKGAMDVMGALLSRLPMPEGRPILEKLTAVPLLYASTVTMVSNTEAGDFLLEPSRFRAALEPASAAELEKILPLLLGSASHGSAETGSQPKWSLSKKTAQNTAIAAALLESTNAGLRAAGLHAQGSGFLKALGDGNEWVRAEAVKQFALSRPGRERLETVLGPLLADTNPPVAAACALALLDPDIAKAAGVADGLESFEFGSAQIQRTYYSENENDRPLSTLETKPAYLAVAKARMAHSKSSTDQLLLLLLAQHGDYDGLADWIDRHPPSNKEGDFDSVVMTAIGLSRDAKFLPYISGLVKVNKIEY